MPTKWKIWEKRGNWRPVVTCHEGKWEKGLVLKKNEVSEYWQDVRRAQQRRRAERVPKRVRMILALRKHGHTVEKLTEYQYRIDGKIDVYPTHNRYHVLSTGERGGYKQIGDVVRLLKTLEKATR